MLVDGGDRDVSILVARLRQGVNKDTQATRAFIHLETLEGDLLLPRLLMIFEYFEHYEKITSRVFLL